MNEYTIAQIDVGMKCSFEKEITKDMEETFRNISGDENPLHRDDDFAVSVCNGKFHSHIIFGMLTASLYSTIAGVYLPGKYSLIHSFEEISFMKPVYCEDRLKVQAEVIAKDEALKMIRLKVIIKNQNNETVSKAKMKVLVMK